MTDPSADINFKSFSKVNLFYSEDLRTSLSRLGNHNAKDDSNIDLM